jgi:hypothetical protein
MAPAAAIPPEIAVTEYGPDDVTFSLPARRLGVVRHVLGWPLLAVGAGYLYWLSRHGVGATLLAGKPLNPEDWAMVVVMVLLAAGAYFPLGLGLAILLGRREVRLAGGKLRTTERVGPLWRTKRWPLAKLREVQIVGLFPTPAEGVSEDRFLGRADALTGVLADGTRFMIAPGYPRRLLAPLAAEVARRTDAGFDAPEPVEVVTLVPSAPPFTEWEVGECERPAASRAAVEEHPDGVTVNLPPVGFGGANGTMILVGLVAVVIGVGIGYAGAGTAKPQKVLVGAGVVVTAVGGLLAVSGVREARRRTVLGVVGRRLLVFQTGLVRSSRREWAADDLAAVRVGPSGVRVNDEDVPALNLVPRAGPPVTLLTGRDVSELAWLAGLLRRHLRAPAR